MKKTIVAIAAILAVILISSTYFFYVNNYANSSKQTLKIFCAVSLLYPLRQVEADFEAANPNIDVQIEGHGTIQVIRHVTEMGDKIELCCVADYSLIPTMMYSTIDPETNQTYADYYIRFATNEMVLAYTNSSEYANDINATNWYSIIKPWSVALGLANPQVAALGYRALMVIQMASDYYIDPALFHDLITVNMDPSISSDKIGNNYTIMVPEVQAPVKDSSGYSKLTMRSSEIDLINLLQAGTLDYCFVYLSSAKQYNLNYIELPDEINLGNSKYSTNYERVQIKYTTQRFSTITLDRTGETIYYGLTIPSNAPNPGLAKLFITFLLNGEGKMIFEQASHPIFTPSFTDNVTAVPPEIQSLVISEP